MLEESVKELNRATIVKENGGVTDSRAINKFCALMMKYGENCNPESYLNRLQWITCYANVDESLKKEAEREMKNVEAMLSQNRVIEISAKVR